MPKEWFQSSFDSMSKESKSNVASLPRTTSSSSLKSSCSKRKIGETDSDSDIEIVASKIKDDMLTKFQSIDWLKFFQPKEATDLAVHPKKLEELRNWFTVVCSKVPNKILILEGETGSAKTTTLKLIAKECGYDISEWITSTDLDKALLYERSEEVDRDCVFYENQATKFRNFLLHTSQYASLFNDNKRLLIVKDLPNTFTKAKTEEFWSILRTYAEDGMSPLVFVITKANSNSFNMSYTLFPDKIRSEIGIDTISFNPIASTLMKRGIKKIIQMVEANKNYKPYFKAPSDEDVVNLVEQAQGDIRNAVLNLSFASQQSKFKILISKLSKPKGGPKKKKSNDGKTSVDAGLGKNEVLSVMHGLGRVFHPKLEMNINSNLIELTHKPETIADSFSSQSGNFIQMIYSNYIKNFSNVCDISQAAAIFSLSDCLASEYRETQLNQLNLNLVIRSAMVLNKQPAGGFRSVTAHVKKKWKNQNEVNQEEFKISSASLNNGNMIAKKDYFCDYNSFLKIINK